MEVENWKVWKDTRIDKDVDYIKTSRGARGIYEVSDLGNCRKNGINVIPKQDKMVIMQLLVHMYILW